jgi:hypothetical protein
LAIHVCQVERSFNLRLPWRLMLRLITDWVWLNEYSITFP